MAVRYSANEFSALTDEIERQNGALLADPCVGSEVAYKIAGRRAPARTVECRNKARFVVRYECDDDQADRGGGFATVCAIDDEVGKWPRFREAVNAA